MLPASSSSFFHCQSNKYSERNPKLLSCEIFAVLLNLDAFVFAAALQQKDETNKKIKMTRSKS